MINNIKNISKAIKRTKGCVYKCTNKDNGKIYVGCTTMFLGTRISNHFCKCKKEEYRKKFDLYLDMFSNLFIWEILFSSENFKLLEEQEIYFIKHFNANDENIGYNRTTGGLKPKMNESSCKKLSESAKERLSIKENNPFYGKKHTPERIAHFSNIRKGIKPNNGFVLHTEETKQRLSEVRKNLCKNPDFLKRLSEESTSNIKVKCIETGEIYNNIKTAAKNNNMKYSTFKDRLDKKQSINGLYFERL